MSEIFTPEFDREANCLAEASTNPGIEPGEILDIAVRVLVDLPFPTNTYVAQQDEVLRRAKRKMAEAETEKIANPVREATHKILDGAHLFVGYEPADRQDYYPHAQDHDDGPKPAA